MKTALETLPLAAILAVAACGSSTKPEPLGPCSPAALGQTNVGCEFWPTVTGNMVSAS